MRHSEESILIKYFKKLYNKFPKGNILHIDSPDIVVDNDGFKVGIELTEIFQDSHLKSSKLKQLEAYHNKIGTHLVNRIEELYNYKIVVHLGFNDAELAKNSSHLEIVKKCLEACEFHLMKLKVDGYFQIKDLLVLPSCIKRIAVYRFCDSFRSYYGKNEGGFVSELGNSHLDRILEEKHRKMKNYKECDEYWLIIKEGNYYAGTFSNIRLDTPISSDFDRVFIFRYSRSEIIRLK